MTESEWLACTDPTPMLEFLGADASDRKLRFFAAACCRQIWELLTQESSREAVDLAERMPEGSGLAEEKLRLSRSAAESVREQFDECDRWPEYYAAKAAALSLAASARTAAPIVCQDASEAAVWEVQIDYLKAAMAAECAAQAELLRDIFGNPFRPAFIDPSWLAWNDGAVRKLAQAIYDDRAYDRLPHLADALEAAGCTDAAILSHCRSGGEHVRGCWVIDLLLGKS